MFQTEKIFLAFYCGNTYGSEYASGYEYSLLARDQGFEIVSSNAEFNDSSHVDITISSIVRQQKRLYKFDAIAEIFWIRRFASSINRKKEVIWLQNVCVPWLPPFLLVGKADLIKWGPVGGGEKINYKYEIRNIKKIIIECLRDFISKLLSLLFLRYCQFKRQKLQITYRTRFSREFFENLGYKSGPIESERNYLCKTVPKISEGVRRTVLFVGQNLHRKNFESAFVIFSKLRLNNVFDRIVVYGAGFEKYKGIDGVVIKGHVTNIPWGAHESDSVLLIYSLREGIPSIFIEARASGLPVISSPVGYMPELTGMDGLYILPEKSIEFSIKNYDAICQLRSNAKL